MILTSKQASDVTGIEYSIIARHLRTGICPGFRYHSSGKWYIDSDKLIPYCEMLEQKGTVTMYPMEHIQRNLRMMFED